MTFDGNGRPVFSRIGEGMKIASEIDYNPMILFSGATVETSPTPNLTRAEAGRALAGEPSQWERVRPGETIVADELVYFVPIAEKDVLAFRVKCNQRFVGLSEAGNLFRRCQGSAHGSPQPATNGS